LPVQSTSQLSLSRHITPPGHEVIGPQPEQVADCCSQTCTCPARQRRAPTAQLQGGSFFVRSSRLSPPGVAQDATNPHTANTSPTIRSIA
jgi:hypothetical protein